MAEVYNIGNQIKISFKDGSSIVAQVTEQNDSELTCKALSKNEVYNEGDTVFVDTVTDKIEKISLKKESSSIADEALGYGFEGDESEPDCPHCNGVKMYQNGEINDYGTYIWVCPECGYSEDDEDVQERYSMKKKSKRFQYKFDKHKSPWTWNKESELIEKDEEAINKAAMKKQSSKLNYQVLLYSETDFEDTLIQEAKKFNGKYIGHGVGFGDYDIQFEFRNEDNMNRFVNQMKNANFINGIDIQVYDGDNFIENRTVKGMKKQSNIDNKLSGLFDSPDDTFTVRIYSNQRDYENGESEREMQNFDNEDEAYEWIRSFDSPYYYEITVIPKEGQGYVWETGECEPY